MLSQPQLVCSLLRPSDSCVVTQGLQNLKGRSGQGKQEQKLKEKAGLGAEKKRYNAIFAPFLSFPFLLSVCLLHSLMFPLAIDELIIIRYQIQCKTLLW